MYKMMKEYTYDNLMTDIKKLIKDFPEMEMGVIGKSVQERNIYYIRIGNGKNIISYNGAHHGMEWITSALLMRFIREFKIAERENKMLKGFNVSMLSKNTSVYILPMINPDGVELATRGINSVKVPIVRERLMTLNKSGDFSNWQANSNGVDLNHNYAAMWEKSKSMEEEFGIKGAGPTRFSGIAPESESESHALAEFTRKHNFKMVLALHSQGKVIYHNFQGKEPAYALSIAKAFTTISPYVLDDTEGIASYGGYKDWFIDEFQRPGYTIEVGEGRNPLPISQLPQIYKETLPILLGAMTVMLP